MLTTCKVLQILMIIDTVGGQPKDNLGKLMCIWQALSAVTFQACSKKARHNEGMGLNYLFACFLKLVYFCHFFI